MFKNILGGSKKESSTSSKAKESKLRQSNESSSQGFMCPECYESFANPEVFQEHYIMNHEDNKSIQSNSSNRNGSQQHIDERSLKEDLLGEINMTREQKRLLEESREAMTNEMNQLRKNNQELSLEKRELQKALAQIQEEVSARPSFDDFKLLKDELNQIQLRMYDSQADDVTKDREIGGQSSDLDDRAKFKNAPDCEIQSQNEFLNELNEKNCVIDSLNRNINELKIKLSDKDEEFKRERLHLLEKIEQHVQTIESSNAQINQIMNEKHSIENASELLNLKLKNDLDKINDLNAVIIKLEQEKSEYLGLFQNDSKSIDESSEKHEIDNLKKIFEKEKLSLEQDKSDLKAKFEQTLNNQNILIIEKKDLNFKIENLQKLCDENMHQLKKQEETIINIGEEKQSLEATIRELNESITKLKHELNHCKEDYKKEKSKNEELFENFEKIQNELNLKIEKFNGEMNFKNESLHQSQVNLNESNRSNAMLAKNLESTTKDFNDLQLKFNILKNHEDSLQKMIESCQEEILCKNILIENQNMKIDIQNENISKLTSNLKEKSDSIDDLNEKLISLLNQNEALSQAIKLNEAREQENKMLIDQNAVSLNEFKKKLEEAHDQRQKLINENNTLYDQKKKLEEQRNEANSMVKSLNEQLSLHKIEINELKLQSDTLFKSSIHSKQQIDSLTNKLKETQKMNEHFEEQLESNSQTISTLRNKLELLVKNLEENEACKQDLTKKHEMQIKVLNQNLANLRNELKSLKIQELTKENEINELKVQKLEMEAKLSNSIEDRKLLLDRCVASENMSESMKIQNIDLKRKCDDLLAGIHELGREHQTLQLQNYKQSTYKWVEDSEVKNCVSCTKQFSVTLRRHHCRNCGQVFCYECSSQQALVGNNKKPQRVCKICFINLQ